MRVQYSGAVIASLSLAGCVLPGSGGQASSVGGSHSGGDSNQISIGGNPLAGSDSVGGSLTLATGGSTHPTANGGDASTNGGAPTTTAIGGGFSSGGSSQPIPIGGDTSMNGGNPPTTAAGGSPSSGGSSQRISSGGTRPSSGGSMPVTGEGGTFASGGTSNRTIAGGTLSTAGTSWAPGGTTSSSAAGATVFLTGGAGTSAATGGVSGATGGRPSCPSGADVCDDSGKCMVLDSPQHCGSCSNNCETAESSASTNWRCNSGVCLIDTCKSGYDNCDGTTANGCEVDLMSDPLHCGACTDRVCEYPSCMAGECSQISICGRAVVPVDLAAAPFTIVRYKSILGMAQTLNPKDAIVAFGAVTTLAGVLAPPKIQMAIYDSDDSGMPGDILLTSVSAEYTDGADMLAVDGLVEKKLKRPFVITAAQPRKYWIMIWAASDNDVDLISLNLTLDSWEVRSIEAQDAWPRGGEWTSSFQPIPAPSGYRGLYPHLFVRYVPGPTL